MSQKYNGWANWETWVCNLWLGNDYYDLQEEAQHGDVESLADALKEMTEIVIGDVSENKFLQEIVGGFINTVDFKELAEHAQEDVQ